MDDTKAEELLRAERRRVEQLLAQMDQAIGDDRTAADQDGDMFDSAEPLTREGTDESIRAELQNRLDAVGRAGWTDDRSSTRGASPRQPFEVLASPPPPAPSTQRIVYSERETILERGSRSRLTACTHSKIH